MKWDVAVLGGGPGGYAAAGRAGQIGMKTVLIEQDRLGGVCLNRGCIPTKALLESAHVFKQISNAEKYGIQVGQAEIDFPGIIRRSQKIADRMNKGVIFLMKQRGVTVLNGTGKLIAPGKILVHSEKTTETIEADHIIIATGGNPSSLPGVPFDGQYVLNATHVMNLSALPESMIIIGGGAIGVEFAEFYNALGTEITVIEMLDHILPFEDDEIVREIARAFRRKKIKTLEKTRVTRVIVENGMVTVAAENARGEVITRAEKVLVAIGIRPNTQDIGCKTLGIETDRRGFIRTGEGMATNIPGIYAVGDVSGPPLLAHKASMEAVYCINAIAGKSAPGTLNYARIPACTYCQPQTASVGLTEKKAVQDGYEVITGTCPFRANGRSITMNETDGVVKLIFEADTHRLLGAHIAHAGAAELIAELGVALHFNATAEDIAGVVHAHPTLSEAVMEAAAKALGEAIHI